MIDFVDGTAFNNEQGNRSRKLFAAVVLAALDDAIADNKKYGNGPEQIARWARSRDGREVLSCAGIDPNERVVEGLMEFVSKGVRTSVALSREESERRNAAAQAEAAALTAMSTAIFESEADWVGGNPEGDVVLVEFLDYRCGYCRRAHPELRALLEQDGNIRWIVKEYPILGEDSLIASQFIMSARIIGGNQAYETMHDALMTLEGPITQGSLARVARDAGLDPAAVFEGMEDPSIIATLRANRALAQELQINGTPAFVMEDRILRGYLPLEGMQAVVDEVRGG